MDRSELFSESTVRDVCRKSRQIFSKHGLCPEDGEDLAQEIFLQLHENLELAERIESRSFFHRWIENRATDQNRSRARRKFVNLDERAMKPPTGLDGDELMEAEDLRRLVGPSLLRALHNLKGKRQQVMVAYVNRLLIEETEPTYREIAAEVGTSIALISRARKDLQVALEREIRQCWQASTRSCRRYDRSK